MKKLSLNEKALIALRSAVANVIKEQKKTSLPLPVAKNGRVVYLSPHTLKEVKFDASKFVVKKSVAR